LSQAVFFGFGTVAPMDSIGLAEGGHFIDPINDFLVGGIAGVGSAHQK
jgi:hypothetical protein